MALTIAGGVFMHSEKSPRVLVIDGEGRGGMAHYAANLALGLQQHCSATLHTIGSDDGTEVETLSDRVLELSNIGRKIRRQYSDNRYRRIATNLLNIHRPDIVHIASRVGSMRGLVDELSKAGVVVTATVHDPVPHHERRTSWGHIHTFLHERFVMPGLLARCTALHVHSFRHAQELCTYRRAISNGAVYVAQHGAGLTQEIANGQKVPPELENIDPGKYALFFGRIEPYKGLDVLLAAMEEVIRQEPDCRLIIAGAGQLPTIPLTVRPHLVLINRFIADEEIKALFMKSDFTILPYRQATQTGVIAVAAGFSKPCIATNVGALSELIDADRTGLLTKCDASALTAAIVGLLRDKEKCIEMGAAAHALMGEQFGWTTIAKQHLHHYQALLKARARHER